ncbi:putative quinol monooxygenase [Nocardia sp. NPDC101769]|uniref:putative quinol monooxygenase n=1 Tax=Nocardia sp. NPDC101769 TaxID=3364333 RepID=UPI00380456B9
MSNIQLSASIEIQPEHVAEFERTLDVLVASAALEPGVLEYGIWRDRTVPHRFLLFERYADQQALDAHMTLPAVADFVARLPHWLAADSQGALDTTEQLGVIPLPRFSPSPQEV